MKLIRNLIFIILLGIYVNCAFAAEHPAQLENPEDVVVKLYRDFDWEILTDHDLKGMLVDQPLSVLNRYFTPELAQMIANDRKYVKRTRETGHLDFVLLCGSQDPEGLSNIRINRKSRTNIVAVLYDQNGEKDIMEIEYHTTKTQDGWRVSDIHYRPRKSNAFPNPSPIKSLVKLLSMPY